MKPRTTLAKPLPNFRPKFDISEARIADYKIPARYEYKGSKYDELFSKLKIGQCIVLPKNLKTVNTVAKALNAYNKRNGIRAKVISTTVHPDHPDKGFVWSMPENYTRSKHVIPDNKRYTHIYR